MAAIVESVYSSKTPLPACLWKENLNGLVSLFEMLRISAYAFVSVGSGIDHLQITLKLLGEDAAADSESLTEYGRLVNFIHEQCTVMGLGCTKGIIESIQSEQANKNLMNGDIRQAVKEINRSLVQELNNDIFLHVNSENAKSFCRVDAFSPQVSKQFRSCTGDIWSAGNCFALELYDACVFHLMRALERVLCSLAAKFGVAFEQKNWHNIIEELESRIRKIDSTGFGPTWKDEQKKYSEAACQFMFFKDAWRNHVAHGRDTYDPQRAKMIFDSTGHFMRHLADIGLSS